jgi:hypothetical protein
MKILAELFHVKEDMVRNQLEVTYAHDWNVDPYT